MATAQAPEVNAPEQKKYVVLPYVRGMVQRLNLAWREVKMGAPVCQTCQEVNLPRWWETCPHNPYVSQVRTDVVTPTIVCSNDNTEIEPGQIACSECGGSDFVQTGETLKPKFANQPNTRGVRLDESSNGGRGVEHMQRKGYKFLHELGIANMCEFSRCYAPVEDENGRLLPSAVRTTHGTYCSAEEAKLVALHLDAEAVEVFDDRKRRQQLRQISLDG